MYYSSKKSALHRLTVILLVVGLVVCSFGSVAGAQDDFTRFPTNERSAESMVFDLALVRVVGLVGIVFGTGAFILSLPFSALGGNTDEAFQRLMADPARYTFKRPLGDF
jgi:uncharacterized membrane protein YfcA